MALGDIPLLSWKSKAKQQQEYDAYVIWAFPYGKPQQDKIQGLLLEVFPKKTVPMTLIPYLTCKELFDNAIKKMPYNEAVRNVLEIKKYKHILRKDDLPDFLAFVLADREVDENLNYPPVEKIREKIAELKALYMVVNAK